jgi:hypothetical protein
MGILKIHIIGQLYVDVLFSLSLRSPLTHPTNSASPAEEENMGSHYRNDGSDQQHNGLVSPLKCPPNHQQILPHHIVLRRDSTYIYVSGWLCSGTAAFWASFRNVRTKGDNAFNIWWLYSFHHGLCCCTKFSGSVNLQIINRHKCQQSNRSCRWYICRYP